MATVLQFNKEKKQTKVNKRNQNTIIMEYTPLIKFIAQKIVAKSRYALELDEMISYGVIGLIDAIDKFDKTKDNQFKTYAEYRIKGAMLDYLREQDSVSRSVRDKIKLVEKATRELEEKLGRKPNGDELSKKLRLSKEEFYELSNCARSNCFLSIDGHTSNNNDSPYAQFADDDELSNPCNKAEFESIKKVLANAIATLPEKERLVVALYYYEELSLKEIGDTLSISESRASQLHSKAMEKLKDLLDASKEDFDIAA
jgi:RNA polymerase sigma factor FliA